MNITAAMRELPEALRAVVAESGRYERTIRGAGWAEGPVTIVAAGTSLCSARAAEDAFEWLLGWPARAREARDFCSYSLPSLRPRSILIAVSASGEDETAELAARAGRQGVNVLALTANPESSAAKAGRSALTLPSAASEHRRVAGPLIEHAALLLVAAVAAKIFNPRNPRLENFQFERLPDQAASMEIHLADPIRSLALDLKGRRLRLVGGRFCHPAGLQAAALARKLAAPAIEVLTIEDAQEFVPGKLSANDAFLFLSGSHCRVKRYLLSLAVRLKTGPARLFALTGSSDQDLPKLCRLSLLTPDLPELTGSLISLIALERLVLERARMATQTNPDVDDV